MSLFDNSPRSASAIALEDCLVLNLDQTPIVSLTMQNPDLALELINVLSQRLRETGDRMAEAARSRPRELQKLYDQFD
jgi:CRP-like cAMP-binding protein